MDYRYKCTSGHAGWGIIVVMAVMVVISLSCSHTREAVETGPPTGERILDRYVEKSGGIETYNKINNRYMQGTVEIPAAGLTLQTEVYSAKPNRIFTLAQAEAVGEVRSGSDGRVFWENSLMSGPRLLEGGELTEAMQRAAFDRLAYWRKYYTKAEYVGVDSVDGAPVYKVVMTPQSGNPETMYFNQTTGLLIKSESIFKHQMGDLPIEAVLGDYRDVDGILMPFVTRVIVMGQERVVTVTAISQNIDMPDTLFAIPGEIQELMEDQ